jgi:hypothetical protein
VVSEAVLGAELDIQPDVEMIIPITAIITKIDPISKFCLFILIKTPPQFLQP